VDDPNRFVFLDKLARQTQDPSRLRSEILQILIAARDTTAVSLSWTFYHLARHPLVYLRKGQEVTYCVYALHRNPAIWGDDAEQFRPERWEGRTKGWEYLPFNGGPRICLGKQLALM
jgi:cytochrome P450